MSNLRVWGTRILLVCVALTMLALSVPNRSAQTFRGTILGTVTDTSGAAILNAKVTVRNVDTGVERSTDTNADGGYLIPELPIGNVHRHYRTKWISDGRDHWGQCGRGL